MTTSSLTLADDLRECLGEVLGFRAPEAPTGTEPLRFFRQWLAERNLGLVPIAEPAAFDWAGQWIAVVDGRDGEHAVLMFGSPSGVWLDPSGAYDERARIVAGWMPTPLDLHLPTRAPDGTTAGAGAVAAILVAPAAESPLERVESAEALPGRGLAGDRYANGAGTFSAPGRGYELTLVEGEVLDAIELPWQDARRNIVTTGISLNALVGQQFRVGAVECVGRRLAEPCAHLERLARPGLLRPLVHRGGLRADILSGGTISVGDEIWPQGVKGAAAP
ncbi:MAG TPA: MOSC domain-containing protein [Gaiellaceae bacterium]|nr:MOSC domain-containing protein [Gaiellaceae bacterium]